MRILKLVFGALLFTAAMAPFHASAQTNQFRENFIRNYGSFKITQDFWGNSFLGCAATVRSTSGELRFRRRPGSRYQMVFNQAPNSKEYYVALTIDGTRNYNQYDRVQIIGRTVVTLTSDATDAIMGANRSIAIAHGSRKYYWTIGQDMTDVFVAMEDCAKGYLGN